MYTVVMALLLTLIISFTGFAMPDNPQPNKRNRPTKLAHYRVGAYLAGDGTKLRINVDKELEGQVYIQLLDHTGKSYFDRIMDTGESIARLSLDLTELADGNYRLKISNGLEMEIREIKIMTKQPTTLTRTLTVL